MTSAKTEKKGAFAEVSSTQPLVAYFVIHARKKKERGVFWDWFFLACSLKPTLRESRSSQEDWGVWVRYLITWKAEFQSASTLTHRSVLSCRVEVLVISYVSQGWKSMSPIGTVFCGLKGFNSPLCSFHGAWSSQVWASRDYTQTPWSKREPQPLCWWENFSRSDNDIGNRG